MPGRFSILEVTMVLKLICVTVFVLAMCGLGYLLMYITSGDKFDEEDKDGKE